MGYGSEVPESQVQAELEALIELEDSDNESYYTEELPQDCDPVEDDDLPF